MKSRQHIHRTKKTKPSNNKRQNKQHIPNKTRRTKNKEKNNKNTETPGIYWDRVEGKIRKIEERSKKHISSTTKRPSYKRRLERKSQKIPWKSGSKNIEANKHNHNQKQRSKNRSKLISKIRKNIVVKSISYRTGHLL